MWTSKTGRFGSGEMALIESAKADELARSLLASDPIVALRGVAEVWLNDGEKSTKLMSLLENTSLFQHMMAFGTDWQVDKRDLMYAKVLKGMRFKLLFKVYWKAFKAKWGWGSRR